MNATKRRAGVRAALIFGAAIWGCTGCADRPPGGTEDATRASADVPLAVRLEGSCRDVALASSCWKELTAPAGCYFLTHHTDFKFGRMHWSGECADGVAEGTGVLEYLSNSDTPYEFAHEGLMQGGRMHGDWIENSPWGRVTEASYENGRHIGKWTSRTRSGTVLREYHFENDKRNGPSRVWSPDGALLVDSHYMDGRPHGEYLRYSALDGSVLAKGAYANGEREGPWLEAYADFTLEGSYSNGDRSGEWVVRHGEGGVRAQGSYLEDKPQGLWTFRYSDGSTARGAYLGGKRVGVWTVSGPGGETRTLNHARRSNAVPAGGVPLAVRVEGRCGELPLEFPCWKELQSPAHCYLRTTHQDGSQMSLSTMTWSGECAGGMAQGEGTLDQEHPARWASEAAQRFNEGYTASVRRSAEAATLVARMDPRMERYAERTVKRSYRGSLVRGRRNGEWKAAGRRRDGTVEHYVDGERVRAVSTNRRGVVTYEMNYVDDKANGAYVLRSEDGKVVRKGMYADGEEEGQWIEPSFPARGLSMQGAYAGGLRQGEWTVTDGEGQVISRGSFGDGEPQGEWTYRFRNGFTANGAYEHGVRSGVWTVEDSAGAVTTVRYTDGQLITGD